MAGGGDRASRVEWVIGLASAMLVLAMVGYLVREAVWAAGTLPELSVAEERSEPTPGGQLRFVVANRGGRTARAVSVALTVSENGRAVTRRLTIDYVPARSEVAGGFLLPPGPGHLDTTLAVEGYLDP